jgi:hypothetical protein
MTEQELDRVYTQLCHILGQAGEEQTSQVLSRFALLAMLEINDADKIEQLITRAAQRH